MTDVLPPEVCAGLLGETLDSIPIRVFWKDLQLRFLGCNLLFARDAGLSRPEDVIGKTDFDMVWSELAGGYRAADLQVMETGLPRLRHEEPHISTTGEARWVRSSRVPLRDAERRVIGVAGIYEDITEFKLAETAQRRMTRALQLVRKCHALQVRSESERELLVGICRLTVEVGAYRMAWVGLARDDADKSVLPVAVAGLDAGYLEDVAVSWADTPHGQGPTGTAIRCGRTVVNQDYSHNAEVALWREAARVRGFESSIALPLLVEGRVRAVLTLYSHEVGAFIPDEVSLLEELAGDLAFGIATLRARVRHDAVERRLAYLAHYDPLTGLPNRLQLGDLFEQARVRAQEAGLGLGLLYLDLDNFKQINDSLGHGYGDRLLACVAERLCQCLGAADSITRQGGDEFVVLLGNVVDASMVVESTQRLIARFEAPFVLDGHRLHAPFSVGVSLFPEHGSEFALLLKQADTALHHAKGAGRNTYRVFAEQMYSDAIEQIRLQDALRNALAAGDFELHYQPQVDAVSGRIVGVEALLRWRHAREGLIGPAGFIPAAEHSGLIIPLGEWALRQACRQAQAWRAAGLPFLVIAVNVSALQFNRGNIVATVAAALEAAGLPAECLDLELTESILLHDMDQVLPTLGRLKALGVKLSIDDFGTGYSSLAYLQRFAVDKIKIDQSFVRDMGAKNVAIVRAVVQLGHALGLTVIAEGVESGAQLEQLRRDGCNEIQGYLISRPLSAGDFVEYWRRSLAQPLRGASAAGHFQPCGGQCSNDEIGEDARDMRKAGEARQDGWPMAAGRIAYPEQGGHVRDAVGVAHDSGAVAPSLPGNGQPSS
ncbi:sensor domain-containing protein [Paludibacterium yongneupense]|uniref:sensor domain-containing protein n=1 Tax=Paludibacterium yongneupense TaxID=400061 RepID=UPI0004243D77|nr:EAL domain-containing protein [Paludibacterium yongneupense]